MTEQEEISLTLQETGIANFGTDEPDDTEFHTPTVFMQDTNTIPVTEGDDEMMEKIRRQNELREKEGIRAFEYTTPNMRQLMGLSNDEEAGMRLSQLVVVEGKVVTGTDPTFHSIKWNEEEKKYQDTGKDITDAVYRWREGTGDNTHRREIQPLREGPPRGGNPERG